MDLVFHVLGDFWGYPWGRSSLVGLLARRGHTSGWRWNDASWSTDTLANVEARILVLALLGWGAHTAAVRPFRGIRGNNA